MNIECLTIDYELEGARAVIAAQSVSRYILFTHRASVYILFFSHHGATRTGVFFEC